MKKGKKPLIIGESAKRQAAIQEVTDELLTSRFIQELGQKARVERSSIQNEHMDQLREVLAEVGKNIQETGGAPKGMQYCGSLSIHVFKSEALKTAAFATLTNLGTMDFSLADGALRELTGSTLAQYGKNRQKLRSGF
jgi:hypothetical protein